MEGLLKISKLQIKRFINGFNLLSDYDLLLQSFLFINNLGFWGFDCGYLVFKINR